MSQFKVKSLMEIKKVSLRSVALSIVQSGAGAPFKWEK